MIITLADQKADALSAIIQSDTRIEDDGATDTAQEFDHPHG